jgi:hypothetical protein
MLSKIDEIISGVRSRVEDNFAARTSITGWTSRSTAATA